jgi:hypothetical protein
MITTWPLVFIRFKAVGLLLTWEYQILRATMETAVKNQASAAEEIIKRIQNGIHSFVKRKLAVYLMRRSRELLIFLK